MKEILLIVFAFCSIHAFTGETFSQTKTTAKKTVARQTKCKIYKKGKWQAVRCPKSRQSGANYSKTKPQPELGIGIRLSDGVGRGGGMGTGTGNGTGIGAGRGTGDGTTVGAPNTNIKPIPNSTLTVPLKIISKPRAGYTDAARQNNIQGIARVRVTFLANGTIGAVSAVSTLPYGLTERAMEAARRIRFEPAQKNGIPYTVTKVVEYPFYLY